MILAPFSQNQRDYYLRSQSSWLNIAEGGKRAGKNVINVLAFCHAVERSSTRIHLIMGVTVAAARMYIVDCDGFGITYHFVQRYREGTYKDWPCLYLVSAYGHEKIILIHGANDIRSVKRLKGATLGCVYITEANECEPDAVKETFTRTMSVKDPKHFHDLNPKPEGHWYYSDILDFHTKKQAEKPTYGLNYGHFTMADNLSIPLEQLRREADKHDKSSARYKRDILGKRIALEGLVYPMFNADYHIVKAEPRPYTKYWISVDYGTQNATAMGLWGLANGIYYLIDEFYHSGRADNTTKTTTYYYECLKRLAGNRKIEFVIIDPSAAHFAASIDKHRALKAKNAVTKGINDVVKALDDGVIRINACCRHTILEFGLYRWNSKSLDDDVIKDNDHCMDMLRYFVHTMGIVDKSRKIVTIKR